MTPYLKCVPCHSLVSYCLMTLITTHICLIDVLGHWLSPLLEDKLLREGDHFVLFMFVSSVPERVPGP